MPRMREAIRSGWNTSRSSSFSPDTDELDRLAGHLATEMAAPPRASPSSLVQHQAGRGSSRSRNACATLTASWPVMASSDEEDLVGVGGLADRSELVHQVLVDVEAAGGVDASPRRRRRLRASLQRRLDNAAGLVFAVRVEPGRRPLRQRLQLVDRRRPVEVGADEQRAFPVGLAGSIASLAAVVVLPDPWRPTIRMTAGSAEPQRHRLRRPAGSISSSWTILITCWPGVRLFVPRRRGALPHTAQHRLDHG